MAPSWCSRQPPPWHADAVRGPSTPSASDGPMCRPTISRRPSASTATAIMAATEMMRPPSLPDLQVGGVRPQVGPLAGERAVEEGVHPLVDVLARPADPGLVDARQAHRLRQLVHPPGRDAPDPVESAALDPG